MIPGRNASHLSIQELLGSLVAYEGITTADGDPGDITLVDSALIGSNDFITGKSVIILDGNAGREDKIASNFDALTGTITFPAMSSQILSGTPFIILNVANAGSLLIPLASDVTDIKAVTDSIPDAGALSSLGDASGDSLISIVAKLGDDAVTVKNRLDILDAAIALLATAVNLYVVTSNIGDPSPDVLTSLTAKLGNDSASVKGRFDALDSIVAAIPTTDSSGDVTSIKLVTDALPDAGALTTLQNDVAAVKAVTDVVPDAGTLASLAQGADLLVTDGKVDAIKAVTDVIPADIAIQLDTNLPMVMNSIILATGTLTTDSVTVPADIARTEVTNYWDGCLLLITGGSYKGQVRRITTFTGATGVFTLATALAVLPDLVTYAILASQ